MGLSRLSNFLKSVRGNIIYVDPNSLDSTDSTENQGNSLTRPFKTIQRALIEAARFSYQRGKNNDRFLKTTILLYPGEHLVDNRPGWIPFESNTYKLRNGLTINSILEWDFTANFDIADSANDLYKLNSVHGGVIIPRGTSIVGLDLRKTKIRPLYVPNPENTDIERSAVFRVTGGCYLWQFTVLDADPNGLCYKDYTSNQFVPNFSHHKLTVFEYADGVNATNIQDQFLNYYTERTDLEMYYEKVGLVYGPADSREIPNDFPGDVDIQPVVDEYRVVGSKGLEVGITSIRSGNGIDSGSTVITAFLDRPVPELSVDTPIEITDIPAVGYNGQYVVAEVINDTTFKYQVSSVPAEINPLTSGGTLNISVDTVSSASPYIFNCSLRSVYGMCGLHADGNAATGFKSMVVAQFTGIGLQKDDAAFVRYNKDTGLYEDSQIVPGLHTDSLARFKPEYENYHIKASNNSFLQLVSVFAIGYANHFLAESGGDHSITNSNSNFGAKSLIAKGFRDTAFLRDDCGYITHVVAPKEIESEERSVEFISIDANKTVSRGLSQRLYLYNQTDENNPPEHILEGFRIGANYNDRLYVQLTEDGVSNTYSAQILMHDTSLGNKVVGEKRSRVGRSAVGINSISGDIFNFLANHDFLRGESVRVISDTGALPDGLEHNQIYYAITSGVGLNQIRLARTVDNATSLVDIDVNRSGGSLTIVSRVSDKKPNEPGHPIQWDQVEAQWYLTVNPDSTQNSIYTKLSQLVSANKIGDATPRTYIKRKTDTRSNDDKLYKVRYVLPRDNPITCRPPLDGYILQESSDTTGADDFEISKYFGNIPSFSYSSELRNFKFISNATWDSASFKANIYTELPHDLNIGSQVDVVSVASTYNTSATNNLGFNGTFIVTGISSTKHFSYDLVTNPGAFTNNINNRTTSLPRIARRRYTTTYQIFRSKEIQKYEKGKQDGVYHLTLINSSNNPSVSPFSGLSFSQPIQNLYPQVNRDNANSDPEATASYALSDPIGQVVVNESQRSITKETLDKAVSDLNIGFGITNITSSTGTAHTIFSSIDHRLNGISKINVTQPGFAYVDGTYYNIKLVGAANSTTGKNATAVVTISAGTISTVRIMDNGSAYGIGNTLSLVGLSTISGNIPGYITVTEINDSTGDVIKISGISSHVGTKEYNELYTITSVSTGKEKQFNATSVRSLGGAQSGIGSIATSKARVVILGKQLSVNSLTYNPSIGIGTIGFTTSHGLRQGSQIRLYGANDEFFNRSFFVDKVEGITSVDVGFGKSTSTPLLTGSIKVVTTGYSSQKGDIEKTTEFKSSRLIYEYDKVTTVLSSSIFTTSPDSTLLNVSRAVESGLRFGDYLLIDNEIVRINSNVNSNSFSILRGILGTNRETHVIGSVVRRIKVRPVEFRRHSILRASGHTFEYLGFGPGNYSTGLPERQDRLLTPQEEVLSQATKVDGGAIIYTGMNSDGDFYNGNKKLTSTGEDQLFDAPIPTITGEEPPELNSDGGYNLVTPAEVIVNRSIRVDGGPESNIISEFNGPTIFNNKITAKNAIESRELKIKGDLEVARQIGISTLLPTFSGNIGDIVLNADPASDENIGWVYTTENTWKKWGWANDNLYGMVVKGPSLGGDVSNLSKTIEFKSSGLSLDTQFDQSGNSGVSTVTFSLSGALANKIGIQTGTDTESFPIIPVDVNIVKFVGSDVGFGFNIFAEYGTDIVGSGIATVKIESPIRPLNFATGYGFGVPSIANTSPGTRIVYENTFSTGSLTNYATGVNNFELWNSVPENTPSYRFTWYGGNVGIATFTAGNGDATPTLQVRGNITAGNSPTTGNITGGQFISRATGTTAPISIASSAVVWNGTLANTGLNARYLHDAALGRGLVATASSIANTIPVRNSNFVIEGVINRLSNRLGIGETGGYYEDIPARLTYTPFNKTAGDEVVGMSTFKQVSDYWVQKTVNTNVVTFDFTEGPIGYIYDPGLDNNDTVTLINLPKVNNRAYNYTILVSITSGQTYLPSTITIDGVGVIIKWLTASGAPSGLYGAGTYLVGLTLLYNTPKASNTYEILGVLGEYPV